MHLICTHYNARFFWRLVLAPGFAGTRQGAAGIPAWLSYLEMVGGHGRYLGRAARGYASRLPHAARSGYCATLDPNRSAPSQCIHVSLSCTYTRRSVGAARLHEQLQLHSSLCVCAFGARGAFRREVAICVCELELVV